MNEIKLIEAHLRDLKECGMDIECECSCEPSEEMENEGEETSEFEPMDSEEGSKETEFTDLSHPEDEDELTGENEGNYFESYKRLFGEAENPCLPPASYSQAAAAKLGPAAGCITRDGKKGKFAPGFRPDPKKGFVKVDPHAMKTGGTASPHDDISDVQHWSGQPKQ